MKSQIMWAWLDFKDNKLWHIYPKRLCVKICSPDGFKNAVKRGEGKIVKVKVIEVK